MANRFYVPDAVDFSGVQLYQPNFEMLNTVLANKQERWDLVSEAARKMPQAFGSVDQQRRAEKIRENEQRMTDLGSTFKLDLSKGDQALDDFLLDIESDFTPGGEAYQIQQNFQKAKAYSEMVDKMYEDGKITNAQKVNWLNSESAARFGGTNYDVSTGAFDQFDGIDPAVDIDLFSYLDERAKGWKDTALRVPLKDSSGNVRLDPNTGEPMYGPYRSWEWTKTPSGGYYHSISGTMIDHNEVFSEMMRIAGNDPTVMAYLGQEADMAGINAGTMIAVPDGSGGSTTVDARDYYMNERVRSAATSVAEKLSNVQYDDGVYKNWIAAQSMSQRHEWDMAKWEWMKNNAVRRINTVTPGVQHFAPSGKNKTEVDQYREMGQQTMAAAVADLSGNAGFMAALQKTNESLDEDSQLGFENPQALLDAWKDGDIDIEGSGYSRGTFQSYFNRLEDGLRKVGTAETREKGARQQVIATGKLTKDQMKTYDQYDSSQQTLMAQTGLDFGSVDEFEKASNLMFDTFSSFQGEDGNDLHEYYLPDGRKMMKGSRGISIIGTDGSTVERVIPNDSAEYRALERGNSAYETNEDIANKYREGVNEYYGTPVVEDARATNYFDEVTEEQNAEDAKSLREYVTDPANFGYLVNNASNLSPEERKEMFDNRGDGTFNSQPVQTQINGEYVWQLNFMDEQNKEHILFVPLNRMNVPGGMKFLGSERARIGEVIGNAKANGLGDLPYVDPRYSDLQWNTETNADGSTLFSIRTPMSDIPVKMPEQEAFQMLQQREQLQSDLRSINVSMDNYYKYIAPNLMAFSANGANEAEYAQLAQDITRNAQQNGDNVVLSTDDISLLVTNGLYRLYRTQSTRKPPNRRINQ